METPAPPSPAALTSEQRNAIVALRRQHWARARRVSAVLLALWFATTFCTVYFARELAQVQLFGWPLSFYLAAQGSSLTYLAIIAAYAWHMRRLDQRFIQREREIV